MDGRGDGWVEAWKDGWMGVWVGGWTDGWMDGSVGQFGKIPVRQRCLSCLMRAVYLAIAPRNYAWMDGRMDGGIDVYVYVLICILWLGAKAEGN